MHFRRVLVMCAVLVLTPGCAWFPLRGGPASPGPSPSAGDPQAVESAAGESQGAEPGSSNPQAIFDPLHPIKHRAGESVELDGVAISYLGLEATGNQLRARFRVESGSLTAEARLMTPSGEIVAAHMSGSDLLSDPFGSSAEPPSKTSTITLVVGELLIPFEAGPVK